MNVNVIWEGQDITNHVVEYTRQHDICTGVGSLDLIVEGKTSFNFFPWDSIIIKEEGTQVAIYNVASTEKASPDGEYIIAAQDNSKRLTDYFLDKEYTSEELSDTKYWIQLILEEAGIVDYNLPDSDGEPVTIGSQFGMKPAYDSILNLLQLSGWYMYFDASGTCQIGELDTDKTPIHDFHDIDTLNIRKTYSDKMLRNRVYVWGSFEENYGWVTAKAETYLPWFRDDGEDWRSVVYQNSSIYYYSTALEMAEKILSEFSKEIPEKELQVIGLHPNLRVGVYIKHLGRFGSGVGQVTSYIVNVNEGGATTTLIIDKKCPRLFGISDLKAQFIYIGTTQDGVWRKALDGGYWYNYNTNIETQHIRDLTAYNKLLSTVTQDGNLYVNKTGAWQEFIISSGIVDICPATSGRPIDVTSGYFIATSLDRLYEPIGGITAVYSTFTESGFSFENPLPVYPPSGNRSWVVGLTPDRGVRYVHQINYEGTLSLGGGQIDSGRFYDLGVLDLETNDLGHNLISIQTSIKKTWRSSDFGRYGGFGERSVVGRDIYCSIPPPTKGRFIDDMDWGGNTYLPPLNPGYIYYSPAGCDGALTNFYKAYLGDNRYVLQKAWIPSGQAGYISDGFDIWKTDNQSLSDIKRVWKIDDDTYAVFCCFTNDEEKWSVGATARWAKIRLSTESVEDYIDYGKRWLSGGQKYFLTPKDGYCDSYVAGSDGRYVLEAHGNKLNYDENWDAWSGCGFVRVIDLETGNVHFLYDINLDAYFPYIYGGGMGCYTLDLIGGCETPNHVVVAFIRCISGETTYYEQPPTYEVIAFILNKYTGHVMISTFEKDWQLKEFLNDDWSTEHLVGLTEDIEGELNHRNSFVVCLNEDPDVGFGSVMIHVHHQIVGRVYCWGYNWMMPPYWFWGSNYKGTYQQSTVLYMDIQSGSMSPIEYMQVDEGNDDVLPIIPENHWDTFPEWLRKSISEKIYTTYSRNIMSPVIFEALRITKYNTNWNVGFSAPYSLYAYFLVPPSMTPEFYTTYGGELRIADGFKVHPMMDDIDNSIYFTTSSGNDILFGMDIQGHVEKQYSDPYSFWNDGYPTPLANKVSADIAVRGFLDWPGASGVKNYVNKYKILYNDPTIPSGQFNTLFEYKNGMAVETGLGLPTIIYDPPIATSGWLFHKNSSLLGASWTNTSGNFPTMNPNTPITDARLLDIFQGAYFPLASGYSLPDNYFSRFLGTVDSNNNTIKIFNTEYEDNLDRYSVIHFFPVDYEASHVDFTNFFPSPYIFVAAINPASGQQFFQRFTEDSVFYNLSYNLPEGSLITIIRADDRI